MTSRLLLLNWCIFSQKISTSPAAQSYTALLFHLTFLAMATSKKSDNAESRRQEQREPGKEQYRREGDEMRQGGPNPNLRHHDRTRPGASSFTPDSQADTGSSDGVAKTISGDGANTPGRHAEARPNTSSPNKSQGGSWGAAQSSQPQQRTPSAQKSHTSKGPRGDHGKEGRQGSKSGKQS
jgi:hypothetical protein